MDSPGVLLRFGDTPFAAAARGRSFMCVACGQLRYGARYTQRGPEGLVLCPACHDTETERQRHCHAEALREHAEQRSEAEARRAAAALRGVRHGSGPSGLAPLLYACVLGDLAVAKDIVDRADIAKDVDLEATADRGPYAGRTALLLAAQHGHCAIVSLLLERQVQRETVDEQGMTPLMHAAYQGHADVVDELIFSGVHLDRVAFCGYTAMLLAATKGNSIVTLRLLAAGSNPLARTPQGRNALIIACANGHVSTVEALLRVAAIELDATDDEGYNSRDAAIAAGDAYIERIVVDAARAHDPPLDL